MECTIKVAKRKAPISFAVTGKLTYIFSHIQKFGFLMTRLNWYVSVNVDESYSDSVLYLSSL